MIFKSLNIVVATLILLISVNSTAYEITNNSKTHYHFEILNSDELYVFHEFTVHPGEKYINNLNPQNGNKVLYFKAYPDKASFWVWQAFHGTFFVSSKVVISIDDGNLDFKVD